MADFKATVAYLRKMKYMLSHGDQKQLAIRMSELMGREVLPNKISLAFSGGVKDQKFLNSLIAECRKILTPMEAS